jgi:hypothetical protein
MKRPVFRVEATLRNFYEFSTDKKTTDVKYKAGQLFEALDY